MRIFHVSSNHNIDLFEPKVLDRRPEISKAYVWTVDIEKLYGFFFPEECPRLLTFKGESPNFVEDGYAVAYITKDWLKALKSTQVTIYEFDTKYFELYDEIAGYYVSEQLQRPIAKFKIDDCIRALEIYDVDLRVVDDLEKHRLEIMSKTSNYSFRKLK